MDSTDVDEHPSSIKLGPTNWPMWSYVQEIRMKRKELWGIVKGTEIAPPMTNVKKYKGYEKRVSLAASDLVEALTKGEVAFVKHTTDPAEIWKILQKRHEGGGPATEMALLKQLLAMKYNPGTADIISHINDITDISDRLATMGTTLPEKLRVIIVLSSLPDSFSHVVSALEATVTATATPLTMEQVTQQLRNEEVRRTLAHGGQLIGIKTAPSDAETALYSRSAKKETPDISTVRCWDCGEYGHYKSDCKKWKDGGSGGKGETSGNKGELGSGPKSMLALVEEPWKEMMAL